MHLKNKNDFKRNATDLRQEKRRYALRRFIGQSVVVLVFIILLSIAWLFRFEIAAQGIGIVLADTADQIFSEVRYPVDLEKPLTALVSAGQRIAVLSDRSLEVYNSSGRLVASKPLGLQQNALLSAGNRLMVYEQGGYELEIFTGTASTYKTRTQQPIYTAVLSKSGLFARSTAAVGYQSQVEVIDLQGRILLEWVSYEGIATSLDLDDDWGLCTIGTISSDDGLMLSTVSCYRLNDGKSIWDTEIAGEMLLAVKLYSGGKAVAVTDRSVVYIGENGDIASSITHDGLPIRAFVTDETGITAVALGDYAFGHGMQLLLVNEYGRIVARKPVDHAVFDLALHNNEVLAMSAGWVMRYDPALSLVRAISSPGAARFAAVGDVVYTAGERFLDQTKLEAG